MLQISGGDILGLCTHLLDLRAAVQLSIVDERFSDREEEQYRIFLEECDGFESECRRIGLPITASGLSRLKAAIGYEGRFFLKTRIDSLREVFLDEVWDLKFLLVPKEVVVYPAGEPLGREVALRFPQFTEDLDEAAKCLALGMGTATVFHLMRVMELAVRLLGRRLRVKIDVENESWYQITQHAERGIKSLPAKTPKQKKLKEQLGSAVAHLNAVRIAWRNNVMHPKATYTPEESRVIFSHVGLFIKTLATNS